MGETVLYLIQITEYLQFVVVRMVVDKFHTTHLQRVVDIVDIVLYILGTFLEQYGILLLAMMGIYHVGDVTTCGDDSTQLLVLVTDGSYDAFVIELTLNSQLRNPLIFTFRAVNICD